MPKGIYIRTEETIRRISEAQKERFASKGVSKKTRRKMSKSHEGQNISKETRKKISKAHTGKILTKEHKAKIKANHKGMKGRHHSEETKRKISIANKGNIMPPGFGEKIRRQLVGRKKSKEFCKNVSRISKIRWQNPEYKKRVLKAIAKSNSKDKPTKPERKLRNYLNKIFPGKYKFVGNFEIFIGGKCPDFININGQKKIIEIFGIYWHGKERTGRTKNQEENQRIKHFAKYGYKTLIVWEEELKDISKLKRKLIIFNKRKTNG